MLFGRSFAELASVFGFCVGAAFITTAIRTMGYFSVIAPQFESLFLNTDLVNGALLALPGVVGITSIVWLGLWGGVMLGERLHDKLSRDPISIPRKLQVLFEFVSSSWGISVVLAYIAAIVLLEGEYFFIRFLLWMLMAMTNYFLAVEMLLTRKFLHPVFAVSLLVMTYNGLHELGKLEAIEALRNTTERYSVYTNGASYINVQVLRSTPSAILIRVGEDVVYFERSNVIKISREIKTMAKR